MSTGRMPMSGPPSSVVVYTRPPMRSRASTTVTLAPARSSMLAALRPLTPAPTTITSRPTGMAGSGFSGRGWYGTRGEVACVLDQPPRPPILAVRPDGPARCRFGGGPRSPLACRLRSCSSSFATAARMRCRFEAASLASSSCSAWAAGSPGPPLATSWTAARLISSWSMTRMSASAVHCPWRFLDPTSVPLRLRRHVVHSDCVG
mmetsp:Transcript_108970/g.188639  ORF Transcript_108970/g.188639 Transcript_108970/m.188639 type:complete len:205 (+) Transcript_108970:2844-3458(+)